MHDKDLYHGLRILPPQPEFALPKDPLERLQYVAGLALPVSESQRGKYLTALRDLEVPEVNSDHNAHGALANSIFASEQSILHRLGKMEGHLLSDRERHIVRPQLELLGKMPLLALISKQLGHRPEAFAFEEWQYTASIPQLEAMLGQGAVYVKPSAGSRGQFVTRITSQENGYLLESANGSQYVDKLSAFLPDRDSYSASTLFIAEAAIPIALTAQGEPWEIRMVPPLDNVYSYVKVGQPGDIVNNLSQQGYGADPTEVLTSVIQTKHPAASSDAVASYRQSFLNMAQTLAKQVKALSDRLQLQPVRHIVKPHDLKQPEQYDNVINDCFAGTFFVVDMTGIWDGDNLIPQIIEAQPYATLTGLGEEKSRAVRRQVIQALAGKMVRLQAALE